ncbi:MAG: alanine racemase [Thermodesulfobacteriota bacterium]
MNNRPTFAFIDLEAIRYNYLELKKRLSPGVGVMAVVKANAYGHGDVEVARALEEIGCGFFGVAIPGEGVKLREAGVKAPVLILGGVFPEQVESVFDYDLTPVICSEEEARLINEAASKRGVLKKVHLKIDTGMGRLGIRAEVVAPFLDRLKTLNALGLEGVLSHFAESDSPEKGFSSSQVAAFKEAVEKVKKAGFEPEFIHMANSGGAVNIPGSQFNLVRAGIMLYGSYPASRLADKIRLKPAMQIKTRILQIKTLPAGSPVSYLRTFVTKRESRIAVLPIGYGDGLPRSLSGKGSVIVGGKRAPLVGLVCMDLAMCDVTDVEGAGAGDEVVVLGGHGAETITAEEIAEKTGTISYEIFCNISERVRRVYI